MRPIIHSLFILTIALLTWSCENQADEGGQKAQAAAEAPSEAKEPAKQEPAPAADEEASANTETVELTSAGVAFDPAIKPEQLPAGAWYCDMGTVHWAASDKPKDSKCPECGMMLKQYDAAKLEAQKQGAVAPKDHAHDHGEAGHDHGEGDHDHAH